MSDIDVENAPRYFVDHGMIHDRITGKHVEIEEAASIMSMPPDESSLMAWQTVIDIGKRWQETTAERDGLKAGRTVEVDGIVYGEHMIRALRIERDSLRLSEEERTAVLNFYQDCHEVYAVGDGPVPSQAFIAVLKRLLGDRR